MSTVVEAVLVYVVYVAVVFALWRWKRVDYLKIAETRETVRDGIVVPIGLGALVPIVAITVLGWWSPVLTQARTGPTWALVAPVLLGLTAVVGIALFDWRSPGTSKLPLITLGVVFVGVAEELVTRGVLVVGAQKAGWSAVAVFLLSTVLFSLLHAINGFFGMPWGGVAAQLGLTLVAGTALYVGRMSTGSLVVCMVLHAAWDLATLGAAATGTKPRPFQLALVLLTYVAGIVAIWPVLSA